jgi:hypothetical protein
MNIHYGKTVEIGEKDEKLSIISAAGNQSRHAE